MLLYFLLDSELFLYLLYSKRLQLPRPFSCFHSLLSGHRWHVLQILIVLDVSMILMLEYLQDVVGVDLRGTIDEGLQLMVDGALADDRLALDRQPRLELLRHHLSERGKVAEHGRARSAVVAPARSARAPRARAR